jgi:creatinine amidohydrolase
MMTYPIKLEECTWEDIQTAVQEGYETVVIPVASVEQHEFHLPLVTDTLISETLAVRIASRLGNAFAAPVIRPGFSGSDESLPLASETLSHLLEGFCMILAGYGFRYLIVLSTHATNMIELTQITSEIQYKIFETGYMTSVIPYVNLEQYVSQRQSPVLDRFGGRREAISGQVDLLETAMLLAIRPDLVPVSHSESGRKGECYSKDNRIFNSELSPLSQSNSLAGPYGVTAAMGAELLDYLSEEMARDIRTQVLCRR